MCLAASSASRTCASAKKNATGTLTLLKRISITVTVARLLNRRDCCKYSLPVPGVNAGGDQHWKGFCLPPVNVFATVATKACANFCELPRGLKPVLSILHVCCAYSLFEGNPTDYHDVGMYGTFFTQITAKLGEQDQRLKDLNRVKAVLKPKPEDGALALIRWMKVSGTPKR